MQGNVVNRRLYIVRGRLIIYVCLVGLAFCPLGIQSNCFKTVDTRAKFYREGFTQVFLLLSFSTTRFCLAFDKFSVEVQAHFINRIFGTFCIYRNGNISFAQSIFGTSSATSRLRTASKLSFTFGAVASVFYIYVGFR